MRKLLRFLLLIPLSFCGYAASVGKTLCASEEQTYFSCTVSRKTVSICGSPNVSPGTGYLQYRIGATVSTLELEFPQQKVPPKMQFLFGSGGFFNDGSVWNLAFDKGPYTYTIYRFTSASIESSSGVAVKKDGKVISYHRCQEPSVIDKISETDFGSLKMREIGIFAFITGLE